MLLLPRERLWLLLDIYVALTELKHKMSFFLRQQICSSASFCPTFIVDRVWPDELSEVFYVINASRE